MKAWLNKKKELVMYLVFGVLTTLVNYLVYFTANRIFRIHYLPANGLAWVIAVLFAYYTNRRWVFSSRAEGRFQKVLEFVTFVGGRVFSLLVDMLIMFVGIDLLGLADRDFWVKTVAQVFVIVLNYLISKFFVFQKDTGPAGK